MPSLVKATAEVLSVPPPEMRAPASLVSDVPVTKRVTPGCRPMTPVLSMTAPAVAEVGALEQQE